MSSINMSAQHDAQSNGLETVQVKHTKVISVQYLRAFAVLLVLAQHTFSYFGGAAGVDIFFLISGFIMVHIINTTSQSAFDFLSARFFRIAPLYYSASIVYAVCGLAHDPTVLHFLYSFLFLKIGFPEPVLTVGWTLNYEVIFYFLCALGMLFFRKERFRIMCIGAVLLIFTLIKDVWLDLLGGQKYMSGYFLEFVMGMVIYYLWRGYKPEKNTAIIYMIMVFFAICGLVLSAQFILQHYNGTLPFRFLFYGLPGVLLVYASLLLEKHALIPTVPALVFLGDASYSIYLTHPIVVGVYQKVMNLTVSMRHPTYDVGIFLFCVFVGCVCYYFVERRMNKFFKEKLIAVRKTN